VKNKKNKKRIESITNSAFTHNNN